MLKRYRRSRPFDHPAAHCKHQRFDSKPVKISVDGISQQGIERLAVLVATTVPPIDPMPPPNLNSFATTTRQTQPAQSDDQPPALNPVGAHASM